MSHKVPHRFCARMGTQAEMPHEWDRTSTNGDTVFETCLHLGLLEGEPRLPVSSAQGHIQSDLALEELYLERDQSKSARQANMQCCVGGKSDKLSFDA